ncbi:MAG: class I tRNA ligase family protein, partial [Alphaproteobacteria bacterium]|nr:class I tRNA ligase family protein [Alphaproteobacteria bacterium]
RRLRNTLRWLLGSLDGFTESERVDHAQMPDLERYVLHRLTELDTRIRDAVSTYSFTSFYTALHNFCAVDLSAFYFDIRKDSLYCDRPDSLRRRAVRTVLDRLYHCLVTWLAPVLCFTAEEAWLARHPGEGESVHLQVFAQVPEGWRDDALAARWTTIRDLRRVVTGAIERARADKKIGASLQAAPVVYAEEPYREAMRGLDAAELWITSGAELRPVEELGADRDTLFTLADVPGVWTRFATADGSKCERCWRVLPEVGRHADHPTLCGRCVDAVEHLPAAAQ